MIMTSSYDLEESFEEVAIFTYEDAPLPYEGSVDEEAKKLLVEEFGEAPAKVKPKPKAK